MKSVVVAVNARISQPLAHPILSYKTPPTIGPNIFPIEFAVLNIADALSLMDIFF